MATNYEIKPFGESIRDQWKIIMTGSLLAAVFAVLAILNLLGVETTVRLSPWWATLIFTVILAATIIFAILRAGQEQYRGRLELAEKLKPKLEILGVAPIVPGDNYRRIMVKNKTHKTIRFRATLLPDSKTSIKFTLPVDLQPTHCLHGDTVGEIGPNLPHSVEVFIDVSAHSKTVILLMGSGHKLPWPSNQRLELYIGVYPIDESGEADRRWFYIVPQADGTVVFTANGSMPSS
jgi:uncharacterized integral membrane protein